MFPLMNEDPNANMTQNLNNLQMQQQLDNLQSQMHQQQMSFHNTSYNSSLPQPTMPYFAQSTTKYVPITTTGLIIKYIVNTIIVAVFLLFMMIFLVKIGVLEQPQFLMNLGWYNSLYSFIDANFNFTI